MCQNDAVFALGYVRITGEEALPIGPLGAGPSRRQRRPGRPLLARESMVEQTWWLLLVHRSSSFSLSPARLRLPLLCFTTRFLALRAAPQPLVTVGTQHKNLT